LAYALIEEWRPVTPHITTLRNMKAGKNEMTFTIVTSVTVDEV
jgi:hypothetical protein